MKRLLSVILAITMIATFIPAVSAAGEPIVYNFQGGFEGLKHNGAPYINSFIGKTGGTAGKDFWKLTGHFTTVGNIGGVDNTFRLKSNGWVSFEIDIPADGLYSATVNAVEITTTTGNTLSLSIKDSNGAEYVTASAQTVKGSTKTDVQYGTVDLKAGKHTATFAVGTASNWIAVYNMTLTPVESSEPEVKKGLDITYNFAGSFAAGTALTSLDYAHSDGFWAYESNSANIATIANSGNYMRPLGDPATFRIGGKYTGEATWMKFKLNIPQSGSYDIKMNAAYTTSSPVWNVYIWKTDENPESTLSEVYKLTATGLLTEEYSDIDLGTEELSAGEYYLVFYAGNSTNGTNAYLAVNSITLSDSSSENVALPMYYFRAGDTSLEVGEKTNVEIKCTKNSDGTDFDGSSASYSYSSGNDVAEVSEEGVVTAKKAGSATITASAGTFSRSVDITVSDITLSGSISLFVTSSHNVETVKPIAEVVYDADNNQLATPIALEADKVLKCSFNEVVRFTAKTDIPGYTFRGWLRGGSSGKGVFVTENPTFQMRLSSGMYLTAVYEKAGADDGDDVTVEFYNSNGQYLDYDTKTKNTPFSEFEKPITNTLTGYVFSHWSSNSKEEKVADTRTFDRLTRVVAQYNLKADTYEVDVPENMGSEDGKYTYDTEIKLDAGQYGAWSRNGKIVSYGNTYSHYVWENTSTTITFEPLPEQIKLKALITLDSVDGAQMIEWDTTDRAVVEAGIVYSDIGGIPTVSNFTAKAVSKSTEKKGQFTAVGEGVARGYVIYRLGNALKIVYTD